MFFLSIVFYLVFVLMLDFAPSYDNISMVESFVRSAFARIGVGIIKRMPAFKCFQEV